MESTDVINEIRGILPRNSIGKYDLLTIFTHKTVFDKIVKVLSLDISYAQKEITVEPTSWEERELMKTQDDYLVLIKSRVFLGDTQQFQYTESKHKIDKFRFVDFARRKHSL